MKFITRVIIFVLVVTAVVLGYAIYNQLSSNKTVQTQKTSQPSTTQKQATTTSRVAGLTADEQRVLKTPAQDASTAERKEHFDTALRIAQDASALDINGCLGTPLVLRVKQQQKLIIKNTDTVDHVIVFGKDKTQRVLANDKVEFTVDLGKERGLYGYGCDDSQKSGGFLLVSE